MGRTAFHAAVAVTDATSFQNQHHAQNKLPSRLDAEINARDFCA
jgi:hypothetical protein